MIRQSLRAFLDGKSFKIKIVIIITFVMLFIYSSDTLTLYAQTLKVPYASISATYAPLWIAEASGLFKKQNLDVKPVFISAGSVIVPAILSGDVKIANMASPAAITAWARGADLVLVAAGPDRLLHMVMVSPKIKKPEDLKGKKVSSDRYGSLSDLALREALRYYNLSPDKDVAIIQSGASRERLGALKIGAVEGAMLTGDTMYQAEKLGFHAVIDLSKLPIRFPRSGIIVRKPYLQNNRDTVKRFLKAWVEGIKIFRMDREFSIKVLKRYLRTENQENLDKIYEVYSTEHEKIPYPKRDVILFALERLIQKSPEITKLNVDDFIDTRILSELEDESFIKEIYFEKSNR